MPQFFFRPLRKICTWWMPQPAVPPPSSSLFPKHTVAILKSGNSAAWHCVWLTSEGHGEDLHRSTPLPKSDSPLRNALGGRWVVSVEDFSCDNGTKIEVSTQWSGNHPLTRIPPRFPLTLQNLGSENDHRRPIWKSSIFRLISILWGPHAATHALSSWPMQAKAFDGIGWHRTMLLLFFMIFGAPAWLVAFLDLTPLIWKLIQFSEDCQRKTVKASKVTNILLDQTLQLLLSLFATVLALPLTPAQTNKHVAFLRRGKRRKSQMPPAASSNLPWFEESQDPP